MEEENVNDFTQVAIPKYTGSLSASILPGFFAGVEKVGQGQINKIERGEAKAKEAEDKKDDLKRTAQDMLEDTKTVWDIDQQQLIKATEELNKNITTEAVRPGVDIDDLSYGPFAEKVKEEKGKLSRLTKMAEDNSNFYEELVKKRDEQEGDGDKAKFNVAKMEDWISRYKSAKTIEERAAMRYNIDKDSPLQRNYSTWDLATTTKPLFSTDPTTGMKYMDEEVWGNRIFEYISGQDGAGYYEKYKQPGESPETFSARMAQKFGEDTQLVPDQYRYNRPRQSGSGSGTGKQYGIVGIAKKAPEATYQQDSNKSANILYFQKKSGAALPAVGVTRTDKNGNLVSEKMVVNNAFYDKDGVLKVNLTMFDSEGKNKLRDEIVPYLDHYTDYDNYTGMKIDEVLEAEANKTSQGQSGKSGSKTTQGKSSTKKTAAEAMREAQGKK